MSPSHQEGRFVLPDGTSIREAPRRLIRCQRGVGLVELLVVTPMLAIVLLSIYGLYNLGADGQRRTHDRVTSILRQQNGLERMTREMRQAVSVTPVSSQVLDAETYVRPPGGGDSVLRRVRYECLGGSCVRWEGPSNGSLTSGPETVIPGIVNADVFFFEPDNVRPNFVAVKLEVGVKDASNPITLDGGFALRNQATD
jgi:hypothetical protein